MSKLCFIKDLALLAFLFQSCKCYRVVGELLRSCAGLLKSPVQTGSVWVSDPPSHLTAIEDTVAGPELAPFFHAHL